MLKQGWVTTLQTLTAPPLQEKNSAPKPKSRQPAAKRIKRPAAKRIKHSCPTPGCTTTNDKRLACHIRVLHPLHSKAERLPWLQMQVRNLPQM